jgi:hypothetical protein
MGMAAVCRRGIIGVRLKAVLEHTQSKRWREIWCGPDYAERLDCARFIAAFSHHSSLVPSPNPAGLSANFGIRVESAISPISNRPGAAMRAGTKLSSGLRIANPRYSRMQSCATCGLEAGLSSRPPHGIALTGMG